tara:strand:+ start:274 stop:459 length:186 start_codon:yes stop_codon:yes gene_type:complete
LSSLRKKTTKLTRVLYAYALLHKKFSFLSQKKQPKESEDDGDDDCIIDEDDNENGFDHHHE